MSGCQDLLESEVRASCFFCMPSGVWTAKLAASRAWSVYARGYYLRCSVPSCSVLALTTFHADISNETWLFETPTCTVAAWNITRGSISFTQLPPTPFVRTTTSRRKPSSAYKDPDIQQLAYTFKIDAGLTQKLNDIMIEKRLVSPCSNPIKEAP